MSVRPGTTILRRRAFEPLPLGQVRPAGWLLEQLRIQAAGLSGHLDEFWPDVARSAWIGGDADGWERGPYWLDGVVPLAIVLDDDRLKAKVDFWVGTILANQDDDGWLGTARPRPIGDSADSASGHDAHGRELDPWPRFVVLKALIQYHEATQDEQIVPAMLRFLQRLDHLLDERPLREWARFRWADLVLSIHWLHAKTGEEWLLPLAAKVHAQGFDWKGLFERYPYQHRVDGDDRHLVTHVVNNAMGVKAAAVWSRQSGDASDRDGSLHMIDELDRFHGQATQVFSGDEHLAGRNPSQGTELCAVVEYMYSLEILFSILGDGRLADRLESIAFNALPATFSPDMWAHQYVQQVNQVICRVDEDRIYTSNGPDANIFGLEPHFGCCTANMHQGWPKFTAHLWMLTDDGGIVAVSYAPCDVHTAIRGLDVHIHVETRYPFAGDVRLVVRCEPAGRFSLVLRIPGWADGTRIAVDGEDPRVAEEGGFVRIDRVWNRETIVNIAFAMNVRAVKRDPSSVTLHHGPLLLALPIGEDWRQIGGEQPHADWEVYPTTPWAYALDVDMTHPDVQATPAPDPFPASPFAPDAAPLSVTIGGARVKDWGIEHNAAGPVPVAPIAIGESLQELRLIPFGCTNLRVAEFPTLSSKRERPSSMR